MRPIILTSLMFSLAGCGIGDQSTQKTNTDWEFLGNSSEMQHTSDLKVINKENIGSLGLAWWVELPVSDGLVGNPLVKDGIVFQGAPNGQIIANEVKTGKLIWSFKDDNAQQGSSFAGYWGRRFNRGVALSGSNVIIASGDCRLIAVDQHSGKKVWEATSCNSKDMYAITAAPRVGNGLVFIGNACLDTGTTRGYVDAFDAKNGDHRWRFYTVPDDPSKPQSALYENAAKTWGKDWYSKSHGCGSAWDAMTYDPELNQLYIGVGGPAPFDPSKRGENAGDELFTNSIVALDASTGEYKWHFKQTPQDAWNYESSVGIMVANITVGDQSRRAVLSVPKGGFAYALDAKTGRFISGGAYMPMEWASGLDANGRPVTRREGQYWLNSSKSYMQLPNGLGAHGWEAIAFNPDDQTVFIPAMSQPTLVKDDPSSALGGQSFEPIQRSADGKYETYGETVAWDVRKNAVKWRSRLPIPTNGGLLHTSAGLVFQGTGDGRFQVLDDATGKTLWSHDIGGAVRAAPSTVMLDGEQYVLLATGTGTASATGSLNSDAASALRARTPPRLLAFKVGGTQEYPPFAQAQKVAAPVTPRQPEEAAAMGKQLFEASGCIECHGIHGNSAGGRVPNLIYVPPPNYEFFETVVRQGALSKGGGGMPAFADFTDDHLKAIFAYLTNQAWDAHEGKGPVEGTRWNTPQ